MEGEALRSVLNSPQHKGKAPLLLGLPCPSPSPVYPSAPEKATGGDGWGGSPSRPWGWGQGVWPVTVGPTSSKVFLSSLLESWWRGGFQRPTCHPPGKLTAAPDATLGTAVGLWHRRRRARVLAQGGLCSSETQRKAWGLLRTSAVSVPSHRLAKAGVGMRS